MDETYPLGISKPDSLWSKSTIFLAVTLFTAGFFSAFIHLPKKTSLKEVISPLAPIPTSVPTFQLKPPAQSLTGQITSKSGKIEFEGRDEKDYRLLGATNSAVVGDKIKTGENSAATIEFSAQGKLQLDEETEISFLHLLPESFLVHQVNGTVEYTSLGSHDISVKSLHALITFPSGVVRISTFPDEERIVVRIVTGEATIAFVDARDETQVFSLKQGQRVTIDDRRRTLYR